MVRKSLATFIAEELAVINAIKKNGLSEDDIQDRAKAVVSRWQSSHARRDCGTPDDIKLPEDEFDIFTAAEADSEPAKVVEEGGFFDDEVVR